MSIRAGDTPRMIAENPIVEIDGDEMTRVIWAMVKRQLIEPFVDLKLERYDLELPERDRTDDAITVKAAEAIRLHGVGVKCATITPDAARMKEYKLREVWPSPDHTIRALLDGTVFRTPIRVPTLPTLVGTWVKPITVGRHAYGDLYKGVEMEIPGPGRVELVYTPDVGGSPQRLLVHEFHSSGVAAGVHNLDPSIRSFVLSCLHYALSRKLDIWFGTQDAISRTYHGRFTAVFAEEADLRHEEMARAGITCRFMPIDEAVARAVRHEGGFLWACMNCDGDLLSALVASGSGGPGLMTSVLVTPEGHYLFEAGHGTVPAHYRRHRQGQPTSTNPAPTVFAWAGAIAERGDRDGANDLVSFARRLESAVIETIEAGTRTADLAAIGKPVARSATTEEFIERVGERLRARMEVVAPRLS